MSHPVLGDEIDHRAGEPGSELGVYVDDLPDGATLEVETRHHRYKIAKDGHTQIRISGHPVLCPEPVAVEIKGSTGAGMAALRPGFIGRGMRLIFQHPMYYTVTTSRIVDIHRVG